MLKSIGLSRLLFGTFTQSRLLQLVGYYDIPGRKRAELVNGQFLDWIDGLDGRPFFAFLNYFDARDLLVGPLARDRAASRAESVAGVLRPLRGR